MVRYMDDTVIGFEHRTDAERFLRDLGERMRKFGLELHPDKTRLTEFGRHAEVIGSSVGKGSLRRSTFSDLRICAERRVSRGTSWFCARRRVSGCGLSCGR